MVTTAEKPKTEKKRGTLVARYVERKAVAATGKDTDFVHEYRLVHDKSHKHGPYQIYRSLTVDGETRYDELYEYGDSPTHLAKRIPYETAYQKAEKFGVFKTVYDKWLAGKEAEKRAEERKTEEAHEEGRRYNKILDDLGTIKGTKKTTVQIASWSEGKPAKQDVPGYDVGNGVGVAIHGEGRYKSYAVTHLNSGLAMGDRRSKLKEALALAKAAAKLTDWSKYKTDRDVPRAILDKTKDLVRGFTQKRVDEEVARNIQAKPVKTEKPTKEPWQMTKGEFGKFIKWKIDSARVTGDPNAPAVRSKEYDNFQALKKELGIPDLQWTDELNPGQRHQEVIKRALAEGKPVPTDVLRKYPDLSAKPEGIRATAYGSPLEDVKSDLVSELWHRVNVGKKLPVGVQATMKSIRNHIDGMPEHMLRDWHDTLFGSKAKTEAVKVTKPEKAEMPTTTIQITRVQGKRSDMAQRVDRALLAAEVVPVEQAERWLKQPNRYDIAGVDTPGDTIRPTKPSRPRRPKRIRPALMTSSGRLVKQRRGSILR